LPWPGIYHEKPSKPPCSPWADYAQLLDKLRAVYCPEPAVPVSGRQKKSPEPFLLLTEAEENGNWLGRTACNALGGTKVSKPEWGEKRLCGECGTRFYDLSRKPAQCPNCGVEVKVVKARPKRAGPSRPPAPAAASKNPAPAEKKSGRQDKPEDGKDAESEGPGDDDDDDDDLIEDTSDLGGDEDDVSEVMEHMDSGTEDKA
jgi:hypothetical protein